MKRVYAPLIFLAVWVIASTIVVFYPDAMAPLADSFGTGVFEAVAVFLVIMFVLTVISIALLVHEARKMLWHSV